MKREPVIPEKRRRLTRSQRHVLLTRQHFECPECSIFLLAVATTDEHIVPLDLGGSNELSNRALYCTTCAIEKTKADIKRIAKARRLRRAADPETRKKTKRPIRSRGCRKDVRKKLSGVVVPR